MGVTHNSTVTASFGHDQSNGLPRNALQQDGHLATNEQVGLLEMLRRLGFARENQVRLYGTEFQLLSDPIVMTEDVVFVDAIERKTGWRMRVRIPLTVLNIAAHRTAA